MQKHSYCLARYFALQGVNVELFHDYGNSFPKAEVDALGVFSDAEKSYIKVYAFDFPPPGKIPGHYLRRSHRFSRILMEEFVRHPMPDFVIAKGFTSWALLNNRPKGCPPIAVKFHGMNMFQNATGIRGKLEAAMFRPAVRRIMRKADFVLSYGGRITDIIEQQGIPRSKILEYPSGIESEWLDYQVKRAAKTRFLYVGRYERLKGIEEIYQAIRMLPPSEAEGMEFGFVGPIPSDKQIEHSSVKFYGLVTSRQELREIYRQHDVLLSCSYSEGMPNAILEAMALSLTALATDSGAVSMLVNEDTGWLIPSPPNPRTISAKIREIASDPAALEQKKQSAVRLVAQSYTWEHIIQQITQDITRIIK
jgi:glycosyltransferase involved in cell wall biosynthesis